MRRCGSSFLEGFLLKGTGAAGCAAQHRVRCQVFPCVAGAGGVGSGRSGATPGTWARGRPELPTARPQPLLPRLAGMGGVDGRHRPGLCPLLPGACVEQQLRPSGGRQEPGVSRELGREPALAHHRPAESNSPPCLPADGPAKRLVLQVISEGGSEEFSSWLLQRGPSLRL